jgi:hypothetical protein
VEVLSWVQAEAAFRCMASQKDIAFNYVPDGCYSRAHLMALRLVRMGYAPGKVWAFANGESLHARTINTPTGYVQWSWHVAPTVPVRTKHGVVDMVIDPSLFPRPVTVWEWKNSMKKSPDSREPFIYQSRLGEPPLTPRMLKAGGTGYWNGDDPRGNIDEHAFRVMRNYQKLVDTR